MAQKKPPHKAKPTHKERKYDRNFIGRSRQGAAITKYVSRMRRNGTFRPRKGIQRKIRS